MKWKDDGLQQRAPNKLYHRSGADSSFARSLEVSSGAFQTGRLCCCESVECSATAIVIRYLDTSRRKHASVVDAFKASAMPVMPNSTC